jgi:integrase
MAKSFRPRHLELRHRTYFAVLTVPKDVQFILGTKRFFKTTETSDLRIAQAKADLLVIKWKAEIANARNRTNDPILDSAKELNLLLKSSPRHLVEDVIADETERILAASGELVANTFNQVAKGDSKLIETYVDEWEAQQLLTLEKKTVAQMRSDLKHLFSFLPTTNLLSETNCDIWINNVAQTNSYKTASVTRIIGACNNYFRYLQDIGIYAESAVSPFRVPRAYKASKKAKANAKRKSESWIPFLPAELESIYDVAVEKEDDDLVHLIKIGAYSGARIEELCSLKIEHLDFEQKTMTIVDAKTDAGNRIVPIHTRIFSLVKKLSNQSDNEYLFGNLTANKYGDRSNAIGKRFGRIKKDLGFSKKHVFHSIRKTFTTALEQAGVPESITADIVGHDKQTMTYGVYSGGSSLEQKRKAVAKVKFNF